MSYLAPLLTSTQIVECCHETVGPLTDNDINKPDPRKWREIYGRLFEHITSRTIEQATQHLCRTLLFKTNYPDLYEEGFAQMAFTLCMQRTLYQCGFEDFAVKDVITPTSKRCKKIMSAFFNFCNHRELREAFIQEQKEAIERSREQYDSVLNRHTELKARCAKNQETQTQREAEICKVNKELEQETHEMTELTKTQKVAMKTVEEIMLAVSEMDKQKESHKQLLSELQQENEKVSSKIVHSPERFRQDQERLNKRIHELKDEVARKEQIISENRRLVEQTEAKRLAGENACKLGLEVQETIDTQSEKDAEIQKLHETLTEVHEKGSVMSRKEESVAQMLNVRSDQKRQLMVQTNATKQDLFQQLNDLKEYKVKEEKDILKKKKEATEIERSTAAIHQEVNLKKQELEDQKDILKKEFSDYQKEVSEVKAVAQQGMERLKLSLGV